MSNNIQKVVKGISSQTVVTLALGILEIVSFSIMSRLLTTADFGYYASISAVVTIFASFSETGIGAAIIQTKDLHKRFIDNAFTMSLIFGMVISLLLFSLSGILANVVADTSMTTPLMLMSVTLLLNCLSTVFISIMHRRLEFLCIGIIRLVSLITTTIVAICLAYNGYGYYSIIVKAILQALIVFVLTWYYCRTRFCLTIDKNTSYNILNFSGWLMASVLLRNLAHRVDKLLLPRLLSVPALGSYSRPKDFITQISTKINSIFDTALFPVLSSIQNEKEKIKRSFSQSLSLLNTFAILLAMGFAFNSKLIIRIFFGEEWLGLNSVMIVTSLVFVFNIDGRLSDCYLRSMALTKVQFYFRVFETILNIMGVIISYRWGILGVALAMLMTNTITKLIKISYIADIIGLGKSEVLINIISSWKLSCIIAPIGVLGITFLPNSLLGEIIQALIFVICTVTVLLLCPIVVGKTYQDVIHKKIKQKIGLHII